MTHTLTFDAVAEARPGRWPAQQAALPLVPYLDSLRCVIIAAALAGIAVAIYAPIDDWKAGRL